MNWARLIAMLLFSVLIIVGCSSNSGDTGSGTPLSPLLTPPMTMSVNLDDLDYEVLSGTLTPPAGGALGQDLVSWPRNCWFGLVIPPNAVDPAWGPIDFAMSVPTQASYLEHPELEGDLIVRLEPDGLHFLDAITVHATWMPWESGKIPDPLWIHSSSGDSVRAVVEYVPSIRRFRVTFEVDHFSDWRVGPGPR